MVIGGAGYVGQVLVERLAQTRRVLVLDTFWFGKNPKHPNVTLIKGDVREKAWIPTLTDGTGVPDIIHLACLSNDPSADLDPVMTKEINLDSFEPLVVAAKRAGCRRFIYASSSSVYGVSDAPEVTEDHPLKPLTDYSVYKVACEQILKSHCNEHFQGVIVRPATVCGVSPRMRYDLIVNLLCQQAAETGRIKIFGKTNRRPNIHIHDLCRFYETVVDERRLWLNPCAVFNAGGENLTLWQIANRVAATFGGDIVDEGAGNDHRSYRISSEKAWYELGFRPRLLVDHACGDIKAAMVQGLIPKVRTSYHINVEHMRKLGEKAWAS